jgi:hypothetical protein
MRKSDEKMEIATLTLFSHPHSLSVNNAPLPSQAKTVKDTGLQLILLSQILHQNFFVNFFITSRNKNLKKLHHFAARSTPKSPDMAEARELVKKISLFDFDILLSGHGIPVRQQASEKVTEFCRTSVNP